MTFQQRLDGLRPNDNGQATKLFNLREANMPITLNGTGRFIDKTVTREAKSLQRLL